MPHLIIEYSEQQAGPEQVEQMLDAVHRAANQTGLFEENHIRVRAVAYPHSLLGGTSGHFLHTQCRIHVGRSDEQKRDLSEVVLRALRGLGWAAQSITVEVVDMDRATYAKYRSK